MRAVRLIATTSAILALGACSLFVSLDDLSGGNDAGLGIEAGPSDVAAGDAGDAGSIDARAEGGGPFCAGFASPPTLCDDFDEAPLGAVWDAIDAQDAGTITLDKTATLSPPDSLLTTIPSPIDDLNDEDVFLTKTWTTGGTADASQMHCEADMRVEQNGTAACDFYVMLITQSLSAQDITYSSFGIIAGPSQWEAQEYEGLADGGGYEPSPIILAGLPIGLWRHFVIDLNFKAQTVSYAMTDAHLDGTTFDAGAFATTMIAPQTTYSRDFSIGVGPNYAPNGTTTWQTRFDNVWCNLTP